MNTEDLYNSLLTLVERSEARIDKTNEMVQQLTSTCARNTEMYDKHLTSLEESRNVAQENAARSIEVSKNLTELLTILRNDYQGQLESLRKELHTMKDEYRKEMREIRDDYRKLTDSYTRLAENGAGGSKAEVKINRNI